MPYPSGIEGRSALHVMTSPGGEERLALGVAGGALDADDGPLVQLFERPRAGIAARAAQPGDDVVDEVLDAGTLRVEVHARRRDAFLEQRLARAVEARLPLGAAADGTCRGHAERLLEQPAIRVAVHVARRLVRAGEPRAHHHVGRTGGYRERDVARVADAAVGPDLTAEPARLGGALEHRGELRPPDSGHHPRGAHGAGSDSDLHDLCAGV